MYNNNPKTKYVMYSKSGDEIMESNSFLGMIGQTALACILGPAIFMFIIGIILAIVDLF